VTSVTARHEIDTIRSRIVTAADADEEGKRGDGESPGKPLLGRAMSVE